MSYSKNTNAFTIMEIMIVVVILGVIAGFALPNYTKAMERTYAADAISQLSALHAANGVMYARTRSYWPTSTVNNVTTINDTLSINIVPNGMTYSCTGDGTSFTCTATRTTGTFAVQVTEAPLQVSVPANNTTDNPRCISGVACPN